MVKLQSPIGWLGGKRSLSKRIAKLIETIPHETFADLTVGGGSTLFEKEPSAKEVINDINKPLMTFYKDLKQGVDPSKCNTFPNREKFEKAKTKIKNNNNSICDFLLVNKYSFGGNMQRYTPSHEKECKLTKQRGKCSRIVHLIEKKDDYRNRLAKVMLMNTDYQEAKKRLDSPNTVMYIDPPYESEVSKDYQVDLSVISPQKVAEVFSKIKGKAIISFNDSSVVREAFKDKSFNIIPIKTKYSMNAKSKQKDKQELIITNFPLSEQQKKILRGEKE